MIDLHTHTTASDGRCTPRELVARAASSGVTVLAVTDHDTVAGAAEAAAACADSGLTFVPGIEITAVQAEADVHILGYFIDTQSPSLLAFLTEQRQQRIDRLRLMIGKLATLGITLDADAILQPGLRDGGKAAGRPWIARALVAGGHVATTGEAFDRWLARGRPAFVARIGMPPREVIDRIHDAGGVASLAHPGLVGHDEWIRGFAAAGLDALEAYHSEHDAETTAHYLKMAASLSLAVTGGSDFHADESHGPAHPGVVSLPAADFERLDARRQARLRAASRATASGDATSS
ncbi:MAG TPA: PHP domain-containing protein [Vicinamibacterales bacterium]